MDNGWWTASGSLPSSLLPSVVALEGFHQLADLAERAIDRDPVRHSVLRPADEEEARQAHSFPRAEPLRVFRQEPANVWIAAFPWVWLPAVYVAAAMIGHIVIFRTLRAMAADRIHVPGEAASDGAARTVPGSR